MRHNFFTSQYEIKSINSYDLSFTLVRQIKLTNHNIISSYLFLFVSLLQALSFPISEKDNVFCLIYYISLTSSFLRLS